MRHRATREQVYKQVKKDTKAIEEERGFSSGVVEVSPDMTTISNSMLKTIKGLELEFARSKEEVKEAFMIAETEEDYLLCVKHWIGRLLLSGKTLKCHSYSMEGDVVVKDYFQGPYMRHGYVVLSATLNVHSCGSGMGIGLNVERYCPEAKSRETVFGKEWKAKPSRLIGKLFGEKFTTHMCQHHPIKASKCKLHFSRHYLPELYRYIAEDENQTSCMSKTSDEYGLPDTHHPVMAYEGSGNAALALLWNIKKKRHVSRAIVNLDDMNFCTAYGAGGGDRQLINAGLSSSEYMEGMELSKIYYEGTLLVPYVDGSTQKLRESSCGRFLIVDEDGDIEGSYETGRQVTDSICTSCAGRYHEEDMVGDWQGDLVCEGCLGDWYVQDNVGDLVHEDYVTQCQWSEDYYITNDYSFHEVEYEGGMWNNTMYVCTENWQHFINNFDETIVSIDGRCVRPEPEGEEAA